MKKSLTKSLLILLVAVLLIGITGCTQNGDPEKNPTKTIDNRTEIRVGILNDPGEYAVMKSFTNAYEKINTKVKFKIERFSSDYDNAMFGFISANNMPDVVWTGGDKHSPYSSTGVFEPLLSYFAKDKVDLNDFYPSMLETTRLKADVKEMYFAPRDYNKVITFYNKDMFDAAKIPYPKDEWTWSDLLDICKKFREKMDANANPDVGLAEDSYPLDGAVSWSAMYYSVIKGNGGELITKDGKIAFNSPKAKKGLADLKELVDKKYAINPLESNSDLFLASKSAMWFSVRPRLSNNVDAGINFDIATFPALPVPSVGSGCSGYAISAKSKNKDIAWDFVKYIVSKEGQEVFGSTGNGVPVLKSLAENGSWTKYKSEKLNHMAFIKYPERDIFMSYAEGIKPSLHKSVYSEIQNLIIGLYNNYNDLGSLDKLITSGENNLKEIIK